MSQVLKVFGGCEWSVCLCYVLAFGVLRCSHEAVSFQGVETAGLKFRLVDAKEQVVGRLAAQLSVILQVSLSSSCCFDA